jgi:hypothetical protein
VSHSRLDMNVQAGSEVVLTTTTFKSPGSVLLVASSAEELEADFAIIRGLEHDGLFTLV